MPFADAIQHVQSRRCCIHISEALHNQLREFETIYQNRGVRSCKLCPAAPGLHALCEGLAAGCFVLL
jgi:hypothetical protein